MRVGDNIFAQLFMTLQTRVVGPKPGPQLIVFTFVSMHRVAGGASDRALRKTLGHRHPRVLTSSQSNRAITPKAPLQFHAATNKRIFIGKQDAMIGQFVARLKRQAVLYPIWRIEHMKTVTLTANCRGSFVIEPRRRVNLRSRRLSFPARQQAFMKGNVLQ